MDVFPFEVLPVAILSEDAPTRKISVGACAVEINNASAPFRVIDLNNSAREPVPNDAVRANHVKASACRWVFRDWRFDRPFGVKGPLTTRSVAIQLASASLGLWNGFTAGEAESLSTISATLFRNETHVVSSPTTEPED